MRWISRLGTWFRARTIDDVTGSSVERSRDSLTPIDTTRGLDATLLERLPQTPAESFRKRLLLSIEDAYETRSALLRTLDPSVQVLVIPHADSESDAHTLAQVDETLQQVASDGRTLSSLTWSALCAARPPFSPSYLEWGGEQASRLEGDVGLLFFVDTDSIAEGMCLAADQLGLSARVDDDGGVVRVSDGRFAAHIGTSALLAEALWTGRGPYAGILRRAQALPSELRSFQAVLSGLARRFPGARFDVRDDAIVITQHSGTRRIDYRHVAAGIRASGGSTDAWLARVRLDDITHPIGEHALLVRSPRYLRAFPEVLHATHAGHVVVAVREQEGRAVPVLAEPDDPAGRFEHFVAEAARQRPFFRVEAMAWLLVDDEAGRKGRALCIVGDRAASIASDPQLVRGALEQIGPVTEERVRVLSFSEDTVVITDVDIHDELLTTAQRLTKQLERDLQDEPADVVELDHIIDLPACGFGLFDLRPVPDAYFAVREQLTVTTSLRPGMRDYLRGVLHRMLGRPADAVTSFEQAVRRNNQDGEMNFALGTALQVQGDHTRSLAFLQRAAKVLPEHPEAHNALGKAHEHAGDVVNARTSFERAVQLAPDEVPFLVNLARMYCGEEHYAEARKALERALRVEPFSADAHATLALVFHKLGDRPRALHHAREALAEQPDDERVRDLLRLLVVDEPGSALH